MRKREPMEPASIVVGIIGFIVIFGMFSIIMSFFEKDHLEQIRTFKPESSYRTEFEQYKDSEDCSVVIIDE